MGIWIVPPCDPRAPFWVGRATATATATATTTVDDDASPARSLSTATTAGGGSGTGRESPRVIRTAPRRGARASVAPAEHCATFPPSRAPPQSHPHVATLSMRLPPHHHPHAVLRGGERAGLGKGTWWGKTPVVPVTGSAPLRGKWGVPGPVAPHTLPTTLRAEGCLSGGGGGGGLRRRPCQRKCHGGDKIHSALCP